MAPYDPHTSIFNDNSLCFGRPMEPSLEIRKLPPSNVRELSTILENAECWKRLMAIIPKTLKADNYKCDITIDNLAKYKSTHFQLIENASEKYKKDCTVILFDEWGTSGRIRPTLGHLLYLLIKAELFRAADYVAVQLLNQPPPARPSCGPAAFITDVPEPPAMPTSAQQRDEIELLLDQIDYPSSAIELLRNHSTESSNPENIPNVIPEIVISETPDVEEPPPSFTAPPIVIQKNRTQQHKENSNSVSDMMKFSNESENNVTIPNFSLLLNKKVNSESNSSNSNMTQSDSSYNSNSSQIPDTADNIPHISGLLESNHSDVIPNLTELNMNSTSTGNIPMLSALDNNSQESNSSALNCNQSELIPDFAALKSSSDEHSFNSSQTGSNSSTFLNNSSTISKMSNQSKNSRPCISPLPVLSLNTQLPHFSYHELVTATNNFNDTPFTDKNEMGRFLGSGAFGSVYFAVGLLDRPVAVKKLVLENVDVVNVDDDVTKQFRNEVEVLSKYKHDNLLSIIGYSCDGCTYCLLYEYIPGGALKDRLRSNHMLFWTERLYIAIGTAKAVSYLHTAFSTPLVHRDIKSANILLDLENKPKLCDFGLIKLSPNQNTNNDTTILGTSVYMAGEAFSGDVSVKLDTFSFGVVLLELLTSLPPLDESREEHDLISYVEEKCDDDISPLLDRSAGNWETNNCNFANELFEIALTCLKEKLERPEMVEVTKLLENLLKKSVPKEM